MIINNINVFNSTIVDRTITFNIIIIIDDTIFFTII